MGFQWYIDFELSVSIRVVSEVRDAWFGLFWHQYNIHKFLRSTWPKIVLVWRRVRVKGAPPPKTVGRVIYHTIPRRNWNILIPLWYFCHRPVFAIKLKNWLDPTRNLELQFWVLLVVTNKNHGQPFVQYAVSGEPNSMGASYRPGELPIEFVSPESIMRLFQRYKMLDF